MWIEEITPGETVTLIATFQQERLEFTTTVQESYEKKHIILTDVITKDDKVLTFHAKGLLVNLMTKPKDKAPQVFKNVAIRLMKKQDGSLCYSITTLAESKDFNRREAFRCYIGIPTSVQGGGNKAAYDAVIKDVSISGFSIICSADVEFRENQVLHVLLNDRIEELAENYSFHLYGIIVRIEELDNGNIVYGCRLNTRVNGIDAYIMKKERVRLKKTNGGVS